MRKKVVNDFRLHKNTRDTINSESSREVSKLVFTLILLSAIITYTHTQLIKYEFMFSIVALSSEAIQLL